MDIPDNDVTVEHRGAVALVRLNRPETLNAMTRPMAELYATTLRELDVDPGVRAIVVTGAGRGFCSGADTALLGGGADGIWRHVIPSREDLPGFVRILATPVITAVNGAVAGVGLAYMMGADVRFAAREAKITTSFAKLGLAAEYGLSWLLPRVIGVGRTLDLLLSSRVITGAEAYDLGLVEYTVPREELLDVALAYATDLAENCSPTAMARIKAQVYADLARTPEEALTDTLTHMDAAFRAADMAEAMAARAEKRSAAFQPLSPL